MNDHEWILRGSWNLKKVGNEDYIIFSEKIQQTNQKYVLLCVFYF